jgi:hypothetical protein
MIRFFFIAVFLCGVSVAFAEELSSTGFRVQRSSINSFGGFGTSTSFLAEYGEHEIFGGEATSTSFLLQMGPTLFGSATFETRTWRWWDDESSETPSVPFTSENYAPIEINTGDTIKLRIAVAETASFGMEAAKFVLQYATTSLFSSQVYTPAESADCISSGAAWCYADGGGSDGVKITTKLLSSTDACSGSVGAGCGTHTESGTTLGTETHPANAVAEYEFTIENSAAATSTVYFFRLFEKVSSTTVALGSGASYPSLVTGGATLIFSIGGLPAGTTTEGVVTAISTTASGIVFGSLANDTEINAAHRLSISTNAVSGYRIYVFSRQGLLNETSAEIAPVLGTNATPLSWGSGCLVSVEGCFGYHTGQDILSSGTTTRFAPDDTYARFTSSPEEVAYAPSSVQDRTTDVVYRIQKRTTQESGLYTTDLVYLAVPTF